ncbi:proteasome assembly chaperone family protein [Candidatus Woesearchaeota archaeon]|nr:MAG: proteasome assembly chaperone family protein [Candidatus Woesearchaeota archaeon]
MEIKLTKKPKNVTIIEGFPGLGLIGTICTEYLIKHLEAESIGSIWSKSLMPIAAVHESKVAKPLEIFYSKKYNILILHALSDVNGIEWDISDALEKLYKQVSAKEIISVEGIMSQLEEPEVYFICSNNKSKNKFLAANVKELKEGIIMGVTAAIMLKDKSLNSTGIFVGTHSRLPDSRSAAKIIEVLDKYLGLDIDYKPLVKAAEEFETKLKQLLEKTKASLQHNKDHKLDYLG